MENFETIRIENLEIVMELSKKKRHGRRNDY